MLNFRKYVRFETIQYKKKKKKVVYRKEISTLGHIWLGISLLKYHHYLTCFQCLFFCCYGSYSLVYFKASLFPKIFADMNKNA